MEQIQNDAHHVVEQAEEALRHSIVNAFQTMLGLSSAVGESYSGSPAVSVSRSVAGVIGWVGKWSGTGIVECSPEAACKIANIMLGTEETALNEDSLDAIAEMANIIFGGMKTELESTLGVMGLSTPTVIYGNSVGMRSSGESFIMLPVTFAEHTLTIKLFMTRIAEKKESFNYFWSATAAGAA